MQVCRLSSSNTILYHINSHDVSELWQKQVESDWSIVSLSLHAIHIILGCNYYTCIQALLSDPLGSPLTGYLLHYHFYNNITIIELPALNTSYTLDGVPSDLVYTITVSALSDVWPSKNNPSVQFGELSTQTYCVKMCCYFF